MSTWIYLIMTETNGYIYPVTAYRKEKWAKEKLEQLSNLSNDGKEFGLHNENVKYWIESVRFK